MRGSYLSNESKNTSPRFSLTEIQAIACLRETDTGKLESQHTEGESGERAEPQWRCSFGAFNPN